MHRHGGTNRSRNATRFHRIQTPVHTVIQRTTAVLLATLFALSATSVYAGDVAPTDDAEVRANTPNAILGGRNSLAVRGAVLQRSLLQFDLSGYSGPIVNATLKLPVTHVFRAGGFEVRRLLSDWDEATVNFNNQPAIGSQVAAVKSVGTTDVNRIISVDVTALVQALIDNPESNFGFALVPAGAIYIKTGSGEAATGPVLTIEAEGPPPADPLVIENVFVGADSLAIAGQNFDNGAAPTVSLSGVGNLTVEEFSATSIAAILPAGELASGDYLLTVSTGSDAGQSVTFNLTVGATGIQGPPGPQGPVGPEGPQGPQGESGPAGPAGSAGPVGPMGKAGADGKAGPMGPPGADGADGQTGPMGPAGEPGAMGLQGIRGLAGATGPAGATGSAGATGPQGPRGLTGVEGPAGSQGIPGPRGLPGIPGLTGPIGPAGPVGISGYQVVTTCGASTIPINVGFMNVEASCPTGKRAVGGGYISNSLIVKVTASAAIDVLGAGWKVTFRNTETLQSGTGQFCAQALCVNIQ